VGDKVEVDVEVALAPMMLVGKRMRGEGLEVIELVEVTETVPEIEAVIETEDVTEEVAENTTAVTAFGSTFVPALEL